MSESPEPRKSRLVSLAILPLGVAAVAFGYYGNVLYAKWFGLIVRGQLGFVWVGASFILFGIGQLIWPVLPLASPKSGPATLTTVWRMLPLFWKVWVAFSVIVGALAMVACDVWQKLPR